MSLSSQPVATVVPLTKLSSDGALDDQELRRVDPGVYAGRYVGHRIVKAFDSFKVQAFFQLLDSTESECIIPGWFKVVKCGEKAYKPRTAKTHLGRCLDGTTGSWRGAWGEVQQVRDLRVSIVDVIHNGTRDLLPKRQQYSKVQRFWSVSVLGEDG